MTRCRQGDLAIIVKSFGKGQSLGTIVRCIALDPMAMFVGGYVGPAWNIDPPVMRSDGKGLTAWAPDEFLHPIRDPGDDAIDEIIQRVGKPADVTLREFEEALEELKRVVSRELKELERELSR